MNFIDTLEIGKSYRIQDLRKIASELNEQEFFIIMNSLDSKKIQFYFKIEAPSGVFSEFTDLNDPKAYVDPITNKKFNVSIDNTFFFYKRI